MAVTKIRKISSWTLLACIVISVIILGLFFSGGVVDPAAEMLNYVNTDLLLNWTYILFGLTIISTLVFAVWQFISSFSTDKKGAIMGIGAIILLGAIFGIAYAIGDPTPLPNINADSAQFNTHEWLKITDMWIYTTYIMIALIVIAVVAGNVRKIFNR